MYGYMKCRNLLSRARGEDRGAPPGSSIISQEGRGGTPGASFPRPSHTGSALTQHSTEAGGVVLVFRTLYNTKDIRHNKARQGLIEPPAKKIALGSISRNARSDYGQ